MLMRKPLPCPGRRRQIPKSFSWIDHRFVRDRYITCCSHAALSLYLFLVTVADADGLSYYADSSAAQLLNMSESELRSARSELIGAGLLSYSRPLYQVLSLERVAALPGAARSSGGAQ